VRIALGAVWHRVASLLLIENMMLFVLGAAGGMGLTIVTTRLMGRFPLPVDLPIELELSPDFRVLAFALCAALAIGLVFGLIPALQATRANVNARLRDGTAGAGARRSRLRNTLVVGQMALSLVLLVGSALFLRALDRGRRVDPGFDVNQVITLQLDAQSYGYDESRGREFFRSLAERAALLPGVTGASFAKSLPLSNTTQGDGVYVPGYVGPESEDPSGVGVNLATVDKDFFEVLRIPILRGRGFSAADDATGAKVVVLSETLAKRFWPDAEPIGRSIRVGSDTVTVVGVARTAKFKSLSEHDEPLLYLPLAQRYSPDRHLLVRSSANNLVTVESGLRKIVQDLDPSLSPPAITLAEATAIALLPQRVAALVTGVLGMVGLLLATVGLYGVVAYSTSQRAREMGMRMALGATRRDVVGLVLGEGMRLVLVGGVAGIVVSFLATRVLAQFLFGVSSLDAVAFVGGGIWT
jgi:predicted permease